MNSKPDYNTLYETAESQAGYFSARQAGQHGFSWERLSDNVKNGRFQRLFRGIYRLTHFPASPHEDMFVAQLRTAPHSVISHESALALYNLSDLLPSEIHLIIPPNTSRRRAGLRLHTNKLQPEEITNREGLRVTTAVRAIADAAIGGLAEELVVQAIQEALRRGLTTREELMAQAAHQKGRAKTIIHKTVAGST